MVSTLISPESSVNTDVCHLCRMVYTDIQKLITSQNSDMDEVYRITLKYFPAKFLEPRPEVLCLECWRQIMDFNGFQEIIFDIQKKSKILESSSSTSNVNGFHKKPNVNNKTVKEEHYSNENCENAGNTTTDIKKIEDKKDIPQAVQEDEDIEIILSDLQEIEMQFSTDNEMSVSESGATNKNENPGGTTPQRSSSKDYLNDDDKAPSCSVEEYSSRQLVNIATGKMSTRSGQAPHHHTKNRKTKLASRAKRAPTPALQCTDRPEQIELNRAKRVKVKKKKI